jgi:hypothetical protein
MAPEYGSASDLVQEREDGRPRMQPAEGVGRAADACDLAAGRLSSGVRRREIGQEEVDELSRALLAVGARVLQRNVRRRLR